MISFVDALGQRGCGRMVAQKEGQLLPDVDDKT